MRYFMLFGLTLYSVTGYPQSVWSKSIYKFENYQLEIKRAPQEVLAAKKLVFLPEDDLAMELASTMMNAFTEFHEVYLVEFGDSSAGNKGKDALKVKLSMVAAEYRESTTEIESAAAQSSGSGGFISYENQAALETRSSKEQDTSVRMKLNIRVMNQKDRVILTRDFSVNERFKLDAVAARGQAIAALETQIKEVFLPQQEIVAIKFITDPKYGLNLPWPSLANQNYKTALELADEVIENTQTQQKNLIATGEKKKQKEAKKWRLREARAIYNKGIVLLAMGRYKEAQTTVAKASMMYNQNFFDEALGVIPDARREAEAYQAYLETIGQSQPKADGAYAELKEKLLQLKSLHEEGLLTEDEYKQKRAILLDIK